MVLGRPRKPLGVKPLWVRIPPPPQSADKCGYRTDKCG
jgi:hypothetical protein